MSVTWIYACVYLLSVTTLMIPQLILFYTNTLVLIIVLMHKTRRILAHPKDTPNRERGRLYVRYEDLF